MIAEKGQKVGRTERSNSRENSTVVATVNADGEVMPPLIIFEEQRVQPAWFGGDRLKDALYAATDSRSCRGQWS